MSNHDTKKKHLMKTNFIDPRDFIIVSEYFCLNDNKLTEITTTNMYSSFLLIK